MRPVYCPHCRRPLAVTREMHGQPVRCPSCSKFFQVNPDGVIPVIVPPAPPPLVPPPLPVGSPSAAAPERDELERFDVGGTIEGKMHELRLEMLAKSAGDNLIVAVAANILSASLLGIGTLLANKDNGLIMALMFLLLMAWLTGIGMIGFGAVQLKNLRLRPYIVAGAYAALGVGVLGILCSFVCALIVGLAMILSTSTFSAGNVALVNYGFNAGPVVFLLVFGILLAAGLFTIYAGHRTLETLKDPELDAVLRLSTE